MASEIEADSEWMAQTATPGLYTGEAFPDSIQGAINALSINDTFPDALYDSMLSAGDDHIGSLSPEEKTDLAREQASSILAHDGKGHRG